MFYSHYHSFIDCQTMKCQSVLGEDTEFDKSESIFGCLDLSDRVRDVFIELDIEHNDDTYAVVLANYVGNLVLSNPVGTCSVNVLLLTLFSDYYVEFTALIEKQKNNRNLRYLIFHYDYGLSMNEEIYSDMLKELCCIFKFNCDGNVTKKLFKQVLKKLKLRKKTTHIKSFVLYRPGHVSSLLYLTNMVTRYKFCIVDNNSIYYYTKNCLLQYLDESSYDVVSFIGKKLSDKASIIQYICDNWH